MGREQSSSALEPFHHRVVRPQLAARQRAVLIAYVTGGHLLPTVAREVGMGPETLKTRPRRIRAEYAEVGRPALTRHDLYARSRTGWCGRRPTATDELATRR
jgi:hypothetical protein